ncbi:hypothetical protein J5N97_005045 [Dioscorea zingiberensis]|uniref:Uncharacterized protein n=1 Tax=Dioscorea zingiberensis TaxID=325984 RepID=A0A9D5HS11_9LILI|nr:hypothetical protein J5N97_005045 [Dioscorea zingiberensis]
MDDCRGSTGLPLSALKVRAPGLSDEAFRSSRLEDDGSSLRCCWVNAGKADVLLRLGEAFRTFFCRHGKSLMIGSKNFREYCGQCHGFNWSSAVEVSPSGTAVTIAADGKYMD